VALELADNFGFLNVDHLDLCIRATDSQELASLVESAAVRNSVSSVHGGNLLHHADIPYFDDSVTVCRADVLTSNRELSVIDGVQVTVEGLHGEPSPHVPNGKSLVS